MRHETHAQIALQFLSDSDREFSSGDHLQASEKLWGATAHAVMAVAIKRDWSDCRSHRAMKNVSGRLSEEVKEDWPIAGFAVAERFHKNFYHDEMHDYDIELERPIVHNFVHKTLALTNGAWQSCG